MQHESVADEYEVAVDVHASRKLLAHGVISLEKMLNVKQTLL